MESLIIEATKETPEVRFNPNGELSIKGVSTPSNINGFYQPIFDWIDQLKESNPSVVKFDFVLDYINTSSSRVIVDLIRRIETIKSEGINVNFAWFYEDEDEDMLELGEDFQMVTGADFKFKVVPQ